MKRKSIFLTLVALFISGFAMAQLTIPATPQWWDGSKLVDLNTLKPTLPAGVKIAGADTIFFCSTLDSLYPIELGYDVAGKKLSPQYGEWKLIATTSSSATAADYNIGNGNNGGAGNAFKVVASGEGGYLFQYKANDGQCGLNPDDVFWVYVFILPDLSVAGLTKDTVFCEKSFNNAAGVIAPLTYDLNTIFGNTANSINYTTLYEQAGMTVSWSGTTNPSVWYTSTPAPSAVVQPRKIGFDSVIYYKFSLSPIPAKYHCGTAGLVDSFGYHVMVQDLNNLTPKSVAICEVDTTGSNGNRKPSDISGLARGIAGTYNPAKIGGGVDWATAMPYPGCVLPLPAGAACVYRLYTFEYKDCDGNPKTIQDTLILRTSPSNGFWGYDTAAECRAAQFNLKSLYDKYQKSKPSLDNTSSSWRELGTKFGGSYPYWTYDNTPGTTTGFLTVLNLNAQQLGSNIGYHYQWKIDAGASCFANDSGRLVLILQDPFKAQDARAQVCANLSAGANELNLSTLTGTNSANYTCSTLGTSLNSGKVTLTPSIIGTHIIDVDVPAGKCGTASNSKVYLKVTSNIKVPSSHTVKFCLSKLPAQINMFEVAGFYTSGSWVVTSPSSLSGWDGTLGILDIGSMGSDLNPVSGGTYTFTFTPVSGSCISNPSVVVTIIITSSII